MRKIKVIRSHYFIAVQTFDMKSITQNILVSICCRLSKHLLVSSRKETNAKNGKEICFMLHDVSVEEVGAEEVDF